MKKLMIATLFILGAKVVCAQETGTEIKESVTATEVSIAQQAYTETAVTDLPESVTAAVAKNYPTASIDKAYINKENQYKLEVSLRDGTSGTLFADEDGNWIDI